MSDSQEIHPPDTSRLEAVMAGAQTFATVAGAISAIPAPIIGPILSGSIAQALGFFGQREIDKRQKAFADDVVRGLESIKVEVAELKESFWTTLFHAAEVARRTHQQEKITALTNAVLNAAKPSAPEDDLQHIFVNIVDDLTPLHLRLLTFLRHPEQFGMDEEDARVLHGLNPRNPRAAWDAIETHVAPSTRRDVIEMCFSDMVNRGLLVDSSDPGPLQGAILPYPTPIAEDFVTFITSQDVPQDAGAGEEGQSRGSSGTAESAR